MRRSRVFVLAGVGFAALFFGGPATAGLYDWHGSMVDSGVDVGAHVSVAVDAPRGIVFIAYYAKDTGDLRVARYVGSGGNCGTGNAWWCEVVAASASWDDPGAHPSIDVRSGPTGPEVAVSYFDDTFAGQLKLARGQCDASSCTWSLEYVDMPPPPLDAFLSEGRYSSLKFDSVGNVHIAYKESYESTSSSALRYAVNDGSHWHRVTLLEGTDLGEYTALDLDSSDRPTIAFYDRGAGYPRVMTYVGAGGSCGPDNEWLCRDARMAGQDAGRFMSMYLDADGVARLAFYNATAETLVYAFPDPADSDNDNNCGFSSVTTDWEWQCEEIETIGSSLTDMGIAIAGDESGEPIIAYQEASDPLSPGVLKAARPYHLTDGSVGPNCGPVRPGDLFQYWSCEVVDNAGSFDLHEGQAVAMTTGSGGNPIVAYHELFTYPYPEEGRVKMVYQPGMGVFQDGFESADATWWSRVVP